MTSKTKTTKRIKRIGFRYKKFGSETKLVKTNPQVLQQVSMDGVYVED